MDEYRRHIARIHRSLEIPADYEKRYGLELCPECTDLSDVESDIYGRPQQVARHVVGPWQCLKAAAQADGVEMNLVSAFRSVEKQTAIIQRKLDAGLSIDDILKASAAPGYSEHHSGRALDLNTPGCDPLIEAFDGTAAFAWLQENAGRFAFKLSYPSNNPYGVMYEPWHWAYVGE